MPTVFKPGHICERHIIAGKKHPRNSRAGFGNELTILVDDFTDLNQADESLKSALVPSKIVEMFQATA